MTRTLLAATAALMLPTALFAAPASKAKPAAKPVALVCPVTGEKIASAKDAVGSSVYKGKTYYFCCSSCKPAFDKDPQKYVKTASVVKPVH
jgi:YHS domain-containing protein